MPTFPNMSYTSGSVHVFLDLSGYEQRYTRAQQWLGDRVLEDCIPYMPISTGSQRQRSHTEDDGKRVIFPGPYAGYLYRGVKMVDAITGKGPRKIPIGPGEYILRFSKGAKLVPTGIPLRFSSPQAMPAWFEHAKSLHGQFWRQGVAEIIGGQ